MKIVEPMAIRGIARGPCLPAGGNERRESALVASEERKKGEKSLVATLVYIQEEREKEAIIAAASQVAERRGSCPFSWLGGERKERDGKYRLKGSPRRGGGKKTFFGHGRKKKEGVDDHGPVTNEEKKDGDPCGERGKRKRGHRTAITLGRGEKIDRGEIRAMQERLDSWDGPRTRGNGDAPGWRP